MCLFASHETRNANIRPALLSGRGRLHADGFAAPNLDVISENMRLVRAKPFP